MQNPKENHKTLERESLTLIPAKMSEVGHVPLFKSLVQRKVYQMNFVNE